VCSVRRGILLFRHVAIAVLLALLLAQKATSWTAHAVLGVLVPRVVQPFLARDDLESGLELHPRLTSFEDAMILLLINVHRVLRAGQEGVLLPLNERTHLRQLKRTKTHVGVSLNGCGVDLSARHLRRVAEGQAFWVAMHGAVVAAIFWVAPVALYPGCALLRAVGSIELFVAALGVVELLMML